MSYMIAKAFNLPCPVRTGIARLAKAVGFGSYPFRVSIGAVERPHYAYLLLSAAQLAHRLRQERVSIVEYGVAGGRGLIALEAHADQIEKLMSVKIEIY